MHSQYQFKKILTHEFPFINNQLKAGLYTLKRVAFYLVKFCNISVDFATELNKVTMHESTKVESLKKDVMNDFVDASLDVHRIITEVGTQQNMFQNEVKLEVIDPLTAFHTKGESKRQELANSENKYSQELTSILNECELCRTTCLQAWDELLKIHRQLDALPHVNKNEVNLKFSLFHFGKDTRQKLQDKLEKQLKLTQTHFQKFESLVPDLLKKFNDYNETFLPFLLNECEILERERLNTLKKHLLKFAEIQQKPYSLKVQMSEEFLTKVIALDADKEMAKHVSSWIKYYGEPPPVRKPATSLPCRSDEIGSTDALHRKLHQNNPGKSTRIRPSTDVGAVSCRQDEQFAQAIFDFKSEDPEYLSFTSGQIIKVIGSNNNNSNLSAQWLSGILQDAPSSTPPAYFPSNYVKFISADGHLGTSSPFEETFSPVSSQILSSPISENVDDELEEYDEEEFEEELTDPSLINKLRAKVSKSKRRYQKDGFDLDLTYVTDNVIAMGFPAEGVSGMYRNNMSDVQRFFDTKHPNSYKIYNLCMEMPPYDPMKFGGRVAEYFFPDHSPPPFTMMAAFAKDASAFLSSSTDHVIAVHCKAGKGRTGVMICCFFLYAGIFEDTESALQYYNEKRTKNHKGVTMPSQIRYVKMFEIALKKQLFAIQPPLTFENRVVITAIRVYGLPRAVRSASAVWFSLDCVSTNLKFNSKGRSEAEIRAAQDMLFFPALNEIGPLNLDVQLTFHYGKTLGSEKLFSVFFCTYFLVEYKEPRSPKNEHIRDDDSKKSFSTPLLTPKSKTTGSKSPRDFGAKPPPHPPRPKSYKFEAGKFELETAWKDRKHKLHPEHISLEILFKQSPVNIHSS